MDRAHGPEGPPVGMSGCHDLPLCWLPPAELSTGLLSCTRGLSQRTLLGSRHPVSIPSVNIRRAADCKNGARCWQISPNTAAARRCLDLRAPGDHGGRVGMDGAHPCASQTQLCCPERTQVISAPCPRTQDTVAVEDPRSPLGSLPDAAQAQFPVPCRGRECMTEPALSPRPSSHCWVRRPRSRQIWGHSTEPRAPLPAVSPCAPPDRGPGEGLTRASSLL